MRAALFGSQARSRDSTAKHGGVVMLVVIMTLAVLIPITGVIGYVVSDLLNYDKAYWKGYADAMKRCPGDYVDPS